jgi:YVTN family beta-propeller protein
MAFTLYPRSAGHALRVAKAPSTRVDTAFDPIVGEAPADLGADGQARAMFVRLAVLTGTAAPVLSLRCDTGAPVVLTAQRQAVFALPGQKGFVGEARFEVDVDGTFVITIGLTTAQQHAWSLGVLNTDANADQDYTWVVADSLADTDHPWIQSNEFDYAAKLVGRSTDGQGAQLALAVDPSTHTTYATRATGTIGWLFRDGAAADTIKLPGPALQCAVDPTTQSLWLTTQSVSVSVRTGNQFVAIGGMQSARGIAIDAVRRRCYVTLFDKGNVAVVDADSRTVVDTFFAGDQPGAVAIDSASGVVAVACMNNSVTIVPPGQLSFTVGVGKLPYSVAVGPGGTTVYTANLGEPTLSVIDVSSRAVTTIATGHPPGEAFTRRGLAVDPQRFLLYFVQGPRVMDTRTGVFTDIAVPQVQNKNHGAVAVDENDHTVMVSFDSSIYSLTPKPK